MLLPDLRQQVFVHAQKMAADQLAHGSQGNISARDSDSGLIAITPSAVDYTTMTVEDTVVIDLDGNVVEGRWRATIETPMHTLFYRRRPDVSAVVHCHAPQTSGFAAAMRPMPMVLAEAAACVGGEVPVAPFVPSGTPQFAEIVLNAIGQCTAAIMGQHGMVACGMNLRRAYATTIAVEDNARAYLLARQIGVDPTPIPAETCAALHDWWLNQYSQKAVRES